MDVLRGLRVSRISESLKGKPDTRVHYQWPCSRHDIDLIEVPDPPNARVAHLTNANPSETPNVNIPRPFARTAVHTLTRSRSLLSIIRALRFRRQRLTLMRADDFGKKCRMARLMGFNGIDRR
jgi:hypothetical protein